MTRFLLPSHCRSRYTTSPLLLLLGFLAVAVFPGCDSGGDNGDDPVATAQVRFLHASADAENLTILADGEEIVTDFTFNRDPATNPALTNYEDVPVEGTVEVQAEDGSSVLTVDASQLEPDTQYMVVLAGGLAAGQNAGTSTPQAIVLRDEFPDLADDEIGLRLIHASASAPPVDIFLVPPGGETAPDNRLVAGVSFTETFPSGSSSFAVETIPSEGRILTVPTPVGPLELPIATGGASFPPGRHVTAIATDTAPGSQFPIVALVQVD